MSLSYSTYALAIIKALSLKKATADEYTGPCPNCGGKDRFRISNFHGDLKHHCRKDCDFIARNNELISRNLLPDWKNRLQPYHVMKQLPLLAAELNGNDVIIPLFDVLTGERLGQQTIKPDGKKLFNRGLKKAQAGAFIGEPSATLYVCEGWATAVAVHLSTEQQTLFALDAKTLPKLAKILDHPNIIIAADNDAEGLTAAEASGKPWCMPDADGSDWWDMWHRNGPAETAVLLSEKLKTEASPLDGFSLSTAKELSQREFKELVWLKDKLLPTPNLALIAGAPKCGKSWYAMGLARDLVSDGHRVLYIANEDSERRLKDRYAKVSFQQSDKLIFLSGLDSERSLPRGEQALDFLKACKDSYPDLACIIIDTIQAIRNPSLKQDYASVENEFSPLRKLAHDLDITIIAVHHTKKKTDFETEPLDQILGSQAITGTVETILVMQREPRSQNVNLFITGKDVEETDDYTLVWNGHGFNEPVERRLASLGSMQRSIFDYVEQNPRCTQAAIVEHLGRTKQQIAEVVGRLLELGLFKTAIGGRLFVNNSS